MGALHVAKYESSSVRAPDDPRGRLVELVSANARSSCIEADDLS
jgi:hypothetical protein